MIIIIKLYKPNVLTMFFKRSPDIYYLLLEKYFGDFIHM